MKVLRNIFIALPLFAISSVAFSGSIYGAKVTATRVDASGVGIATFSIIATSSPACINPAYNNAMSFNANTAGGKGILATLLFARGKNTTVYVTGTGACTTYGGSLEEISILQEQN